MTEENTQQDNQTPDLAKQAEEYLNNWKRAVADLANYKKGEIERAALLVQYSKEDVLHNILPILDSIDLAQSHMPDEIKQTEWGQGFAQIKKQVQDFLAKEGIGEINIKEKEDKFDPAIMNAIQEIPDTGLEPETVVEVVQKGYKTLLKAGRLESENINNRTKIIRPATVKVAK